MAMADELTPAEQDSLIQTFLKPGDDCSHNMAPAFAEVERILTDHRKDWERGILHECIMTMPATGDAADFISVVSSAMIRLRHD